MTERLTSRNIYRLPFGENLNLNPRPAPYHKERIGMEFALDFPMKEGTPILAAARGTVLQVIDRYDAGGPDKSLPENKVNIKHKNEEYTQYVHLKKGIIVKEGNLVTQGQIIGYSGLTGYTTYPHLHFAVRIKEKDSQWKTIVPRFKIGGKISEILSPDL